jgi:membrane protease YdiL (CAAX protease family)
MNIKQLLNREDIKDKLKSQTNRTPLQLVILWILLLVIIILLYKYSPYKIYLTVEDILLGIIGGGLALGLNYLVAFIIKKFKPVKKSGAQLNNFINVLPKSWLVTSYILIVVIEELLCRSYALYYVSIILNVYWAVFINSIIFVLFHFRYKTLQIFILGIIFSVLLLLTDNLLVPCIAHFFNNVLILSKNSNRK